MPFWLVLQLQLLANNLIFPFHVYRKKIFVCTFKNNLRSLVLSGRIYQAVRGYNDSLNVAFIRSFSQDNNKTVYKLLFCRHEWISRTDVWQKFPEIAEAAYFRWRRGDKINDFFRENTLFICLTNKPLNADRVTKAVRGYS